MVPQMGVVMAAEKIDGWAGGDEFWPKDFEAPMPSDVWVEVETDCTWSPHVVPIQG